uniref:Tyrosine specific protein phosphatases domain-containing protein n=1 Tax=Dunaliella tertiolecta TaxID=3047 RepID=A0A7S3QUH6_DUNTE|mmetsp:Transcript_21148/g.58729  ORF Transcript_21148/g.58729 Transcript_21148/m.58729 type:complete len:1483 (+) Transcript_21148:86-4534(+)
MVSAPNEQANEGHCPDMPTGEEGKKAAAGEFDSEEIIANRKGEVLLKHTVLKADHFPSCHNTKLTPILEGAPNFRKVDGLRVFGVAIPTVAGLRRALNSMGAQRGKRCVYWQNLREEPLIFINGHPFVVREADKPFSNLEYTGIDRSRVEGMEVRLKQDILTESSLFGNRILVIHENEDMSLYDHWEPVTPDDVQTPQEVYAELKADGYDVDYLRVPVTDEKAPKDNDFEELIQRLWAVPDDAGVVFNCQMGRGRTTTGMIIASLLYLRKMGAYPLTKGMVLGDPVPEWFRAMAKSRPAPPKEDQEQLKAGMYGVVRSLLRALEKGPEAKMILDAVIDACAGMQNLREGIYSYRLRFLKEAREKQRNVLLNVCLEYLERYYMLIAFTGYLTSSQFDPGSPTHVPFPQWMAERPELRSILIRLLRRNSMAALELHQRTPIKSKGHEVVGPVEDDGIAGGAVDKDGLGTHDKDVVATRTGAVLGAFSILKEDNFPGMQSSKIAQTIPGASNFRGIPGMPIYGVGMPTVEGVRGVLRSVSGSSSPGAGRRVHALWVNMREEPMVYINGKPFVLREEVRPLKNMMEYAGIDAARLEAMEERLKKDVLAEALRHGGHILVAHESFERGHYGQLFDTWEEIDHPDAVQTPANVYSSLAHEGFAVKYVRVPVTDGTAPSYADFDAMVEAMVEWGRDDPMIFNCQMGIGRTTTGMVVASLVHMYHFQALASVRTGPNALEELFPHDTHGLQGYIAAGMSPRSDQDEEDDNEFAAQDDEERKDQHSKVMEWDLQPEELEEQRSLASGGYVGVRRVARLLEEGEAAKRTLDAALDAASSLINLRVSIMKYRKPRSSYKYIRPELQQRDAAFKKGGAYLERYCKLIAFAYYLEHVGPEIKFGDWVNSRPDLKAALTAIHQNPGAALAPLPVPARPTVLLGSSDTKDVAAVQMGVLKKRRGRLLNRRTILKSYLFHEEQGRGPPELPSAPDLRRVEVDRHSILSCGGVTLQGLRDLLAHLGAGPQGSNHVVMTDLREELVVYINGVPYTRRELEMPVAALHHAGVHAAQLEEQEALLREDVTDEVARYSGQLMLHKEVEAATAAQLPMHNLSLSATGGQSRQSMDRSALSDAIRARTPTGAPATEVPASSTAAPAQDPADAILAAYRAAEEDSQQQQQQQQPQPSPPWSSNALGATCSSSARRSSMSMVQSTSLGLDMTAPVDVCPGAQVAAFFENVDLNDPLALVTPAELIQHLVESEGFKASYRRIPLSRERTPEALDIEQVHIQMLDAHAEHAHDGGSPLVHLILSRTATGSSARFVAAALAASYMRDPVCDPQSGSGFWAAPQLRRTSDSGERVLAPATASRSLDHGSGEYRGIMSLCRLLPGGSHAKHMVDQSIGAVSSMGNILEDIRQCKETADAAPDTLLQADPQAVVNSSHSAARQLGLHYLKRYFLLITYRCYLESGGSNQCGFDKWMRQRRELGHLFALLASEI